MNAQPRKMWDTEAWRQWERERKAEGTSTECEEKKEKNKRGRTRRLILLLFRSLINLWETNTSLSFHSLSRTMWLSLIFSYCLIRSSSTFDFFPINLHRCQTIPSNFTLCSGLGYTQMYLPNLLNHESVTEILYELPLWQSLLTLGCHQHARLLLCSILAPVCIQQTPEKQSKLVSFDNNPPDSASPSHQNKKFLYPCRSLCESVKRSCESRMIAQFGYKWPTMSKTSVDQHHFMGGIVWTHRFL